MVHFLNDTIIKKQKFKLWGKGIFTKLYLDRNCQFMVQKQNFRSGKQNSQHLFFKQPITAYEKAGFFFFTVYTTILVYIAVAGAYYARIPTVDLPPNQFVFFFYTPIANCAIKMLYLTYVTYISVKCVYIAS